MKITKKKKKVKLLGKLDSTTETGRDRYPFNPDAVFPPSSNSVNSPTSLAEYSYWTAFRPIVIRIGLSVFPAHVADVCPYSATRAKNVKKTYSAEPAPPVELALHPEHRESLSATATTTWIGYEPDASTISFSLLDYPFVPPSDGAPRSILLLFCIMPLHVGRGSRVAVYSTLSLALHLVDDGKNVLGAI